MRHWPLSVVMSSPLMPPQYAWEAYQAAAYRQMPSQGCVDAAGYIATRTPYVEPSSLVLAQTIGAPLQRVFLSYPDLDEWLAMERGAVVEYDNKISVFVCSMH